jgi:drug/metabolite transporter (DMT)-like permease
MTPDIATDPRQRLIGLARIALAGLIWGSIPLVLRYADGASAVKVFFRVFCAWIVIAGWLLASGGWREVVGLSRAKWLQVMGQGLILTLNWFLFLTAIDMTTVATAELLAYTGPVFVAALAPYVTGERFDRRVVPPLSLALVGIIVILAPHGLALDSRRELIGATLAFGSALTYATLLLRSKKILRGITSGALMFVEYGVASIVLAPLVAMAYLRGAVPSTPGAYAALVSLGVVHTAIAGYIFLGGLRRVRTDHAAILTYVEPVSAVIFAAAFLSEVLTWTTALGGFLVVSGGVIVARMEAREGVETVPLEAAGTEEFPEAPDGPGI